MKGYVQIYTGEGKGKTTAALGLALRAAGAGLNVFIGQFMKGRDYSEIKALERYGDLISIGSAVHEIESTVSAAYQNKRRAVNLEGGMGAKTCRLAAHRRQHKTVHVGSV